METLYIEVYDKNTTVYMYGAITVVVNEISGDYCVVRSPWYSRYMIGMMQRRWDSLGRTKPLIQQQIEARWDAEYGKVVTR